MITTVHGPFDDRIFHKEGKSLADAGFDVTVIAPHNKKETVSGIHIVPLSGTKNRLVRFFLAVVKTYFVAVRTGADIYHIHDPELLFTGFMLKLLNHKIIIYDVHEDYGKKILSKHWINKKFRPILSTILTVLERSISKFFDCLFLADANMITNFKTGNMEVIGNYPPLDFMTARPKANRPGVKIIYIGGVDQDRGSTVMIEMMQYLKNYNVELHVAGPLSNRCAPGLFTAVESIKYHGSVPWRNVSKLLADADIGLLLLQPTPSYVNCSGGGIIKLFEYMLMGLPVIVSDFPGLRKFIAETECGICVDPTNPGKVAEAARFLYENPQTRIEMGEKGRAAVKSKYNWENETGKLIKAYRRALGSK